MGRGRDGRVATADRGVGSFPRAVVTKDHRRRWEWGGGLAATAIDSLTAPEGRSPKSRCPPARAPSKALGEALSRLFRLLAVPGVPRHVAASLHVYLCLQAALLHRVSVCFKFPFRLLIPTPVIGLGPTLNPG